ncbi:hypothetical protein TNCV_4872221 [Trichonephila clavipes]|nr:hypothetical protein TNCV_4872221 [Trichonephila clavipes]
MAPGRLDSMGSTIGVKISSTYLRAVKCLEGPLKRSCVPRNCSHTVTPCEIAVCHSTINAGSDRWPVRLHVRWSSALRLNRDSSLKMTSSPVCHTPSCPRSAKIQSTLPMMWGQW